MPLYNRAGWRRHYEGTYTGGTNLYSTDEGSSWIIYDADCMFEVYGADDYTVIVKKSATYNTLKSGLAAAATQDWGLKLWMPTSLSGYDNNQMSATLTLVASASS